MALPANMSTGGGNFAHTRAGIVLGIFPSTNRTLLMELQAATAAGAPTSKWQLITIAPTLQRELAYTYYAPYSTRTYFFRARHPAQPGFAAGPFTLVVSGKPKILGSSAVEIRGPVLTARANVYALRASSELGATAKSDALNPQGSVLPISGGGGLAMFAWKSGGLGANQMWLSFGWSAQTAYRPDGTTVAIPAPPAVAATPVLSQVAGGALGARTRWARIAYVRVINGFVLLYPVSAEASLAINANNLLKITSPASVAGYDGWVALVGSASNAEFRQGAANSTLAFGSDFTEPAAGFGTTLTQYDNANWKSVTMVDLPISTTFSMYPYYNLITGNVELGPFQGSGGDAATAKIQRADQHIPLSTIVSGTYSGQPQTPAGGGSLSGTFGGGALT